MRESEAKENKRQEQLQKSGVLTEAAGGTPSYVVKSVPQYSSSSSKSKVGPAASRPQQPALLPETTSVGPQVGSVQRNEQESAKREQQYQNEKHLVHTDQGWDRKTNAQIAADENRERTEAAAAAAIAKTVSEKCYVVAAGGGVGTLICNP